MNLIRFKENSLESEKSLEKMVDEMLDKMVYSGGVRLYINNKENQGEEPLGYYPPFGLHGKYEPIVSDSKVDSLISYKGDAGDNMFDFDMTHSSYGKKGEDIFQIHVIWPSKRQDQNIKINSDDLLEGLKKLFESEYKKKFPESEFLKKYKEDMVFCSKLDALLDTIVVRIVAPLEKYPIVKVNLG